MQQGHACIRMKYHYDTIIHGGYPRNNGLEQIRTTYEVAFNRKINLYDVYVSSLLTDSIPIKRIYTLIGPKDEDNKIPTGIMVEASGAVVYVDKFTNKILQGNMSGSEMYDYMYTVFNSMRKVLNTGPFKVESLSSNTTVDPYISLLKFYPFYCTFHHMKDSFPNMFKLGYFKYILQRYYTSTQNDAESLLQSISENKFSTNPEEIYSIMTCHNTICLS